MPAFRTELLSWYDMHQRVLPWRSERPEPYHVLVSETMLQQTQVATVIGYFERFIAELPSVQALAEAQEQTVLRLWQGLGYYRRARNLHAAARVIVSDFDGAVPDTVDALLGLPGVGRYTAGAIASLAHGVAAPILDGNVQRVVCRLDAITGDPRTPANQRQLWERAAELVPEDRPGAFNSALMELGATVCTPTAPRCLLCPVQRHCFAYAQGLTDVIPPPRRTKATALEERDIYVICRNNGCVRIEQRPADGRWANLWQFTTVRRDMPPPIKVEGLRSVGEVKHALTHRRYHFRVFAGTASGPGTWVEPAALDGYAMSKPQLRAWQLSESAPGGL